MGMKEMTEDFITIKGAAQISGLSESALRYYEKMGILPYASRNENGHRYYSKSKLESIIFLMRLKRTGMKLNEIKHYLRLFEEGPDTIFERISIIEKQRDKINKDISRLLETRDILDYKIDHYHEALLNPDLSNNNCASK